MLKLIEQLKEAGVVIERKNKLIVHGWKDRQAPLSARDRKRLQRWRDGVTNRDVEVTKDADNSDYIKKEIKSKNRVRKDKKKTTTLFNLCFITPFMIHHDINDIPIRALKQISRI